MPDTLILRTTDRTMDARREPTNSATTVIDDPAAALELTVVVPTFKEAQNVPLVVERLDEVLAGVAWEVVFVDDDSPDGTAEVARSIALRDRRVRVIRRIGRRGLSSACVEGVLSSAAPYFAVMDGDLQHDDAVLPQMFDRLKRDHLDIVVGSRYVAGGDTGGLSSPTRETISRLGGQVARLVLHADLDDPMSGFFVMSRAAFDETVHGLSQQGFKILLDIFASSPRPLRFAEVPCRFHSRQHGESKLDSKVAWEYGMLIADKLVGRYVPVRFVVFALIGGTGLVVHLAALFLAGSIGFNFTISQSFAVVVAMTWNFIFNNIITYRDLKLRGLDFLRGLLTFYAIGAVGALANVGVAEVIHLRGWTWALAGLSGALVGVAWNFTMSSFFTWRRDPAH